MVPDPPHSNDLELFLRTVRHVYTSVEASQVDLKFDREYPGNFALSEAREVIRV